MIYEGSEGSINCYYKNKLIISRPLTKKKTVHYYAGLSNAYMVDGLRNGFTLSSLTKLNLDFIKMLRYKTFVNKPKSEDLDTAMMCYFMLCKLNVIDCEGDREGFLVMPKREIPFRQR